MGIEKLKSFLEIHNEFESAEQLAEKHWNLHEKKYLCNLNTRGEVSKMSFVAGYKKAMEIVTNIIK